jgi:hypothetical protein
VKKNEILVGGPCGPNHFYIKIELVSPEWVFDSVKKDLEKLASSTLEIYDKLPEETSAKRRYRLVRRLLISQIDQWCSERYWSAITDFNFEYGRNLFVTIKSS